MRWPGGLAALLATVVVPGCAPVVVPVAEPAQPAPAIGPQLVVDIRNHTGRDVELGYEFESPNASGGGSGGVPSCERTTVTFGELAGRYELLVDGEVVFDGIVPAAAPGDVFVVLRMTVEPDGAVGVEAEPGWRRIMPDPVSQPLFDCG